MNIIVCGDRNWSNDKRLQSFLDLINFNSKIKLVIEGEASGADTLGRLWAQARGIPVKPFPADWAKYHRAAGPIRNQQMLDELPDLVVAFHNDLDQSKGTKNMLKIALKKGVMGMLVSDKASHFFDGPKILCENLDVDQLILSASRELRMLSIITKTKLETKP